MVLQQSDSKYANTGNKTSHHTYVGHHVLDTLVQLGQERDEGLAGDGEGRRVQPLGDLVQLKEVGELGLDQLGLLAQLRLPGGEHSQRMADSAGTG